MMDKTAASRRPPFMQGLLKRVEHEARMRCARDTPANDATGVGVDHEGHIDEPGPGADVGEVGEPGSLQMRYQSGSRAVGGLGVRLRHRRPLMHRIVSALSRRLESLPKRLFLNF
jgi:hypothetical protein